jgi:hypothetical protein
MINLVGRTSNIFSVNLQRLKPMIVCAVLALVAGNSQAATFTWDGGVGGTGTDMSTAADWNPDGNPSANGDTMRWNGTVAGNLSLTWSGTTLGGAGGNTGPLFDIVGTQTGSLLIDAGSNTNAARLNTWGGEEITLATRAHLEHIVIQETRACPD